MSVIANEQTLDATNLSDVIVGPSNLRHPVCKIHEYKNGGFRLGYPTCLKRRKIPEIKPLQDYRSNIQWKQVFVSW